MTYDTARAAERAVLAAVETQRDELSAEASLDELAELAKTAGAIEAGRLTQKRERPDHATYLGKGKIEELQAAIHAFEADMVIFDDELSPAQLRNLAEKLPDVKLVDRTLLILDIFARRASTAENAAQVELAQLRYRLSRLAGSGAGLSRLAGGIGTRGPGETKLETDRRRIRDKIAALNEEIGRIETKRDVMRKQRQKSGVPVVSCVGYTNAGKSTLMNLISHAGVLAEDKLFATLDTTTRRMRTANGAEFLLTDTVGFIRKLPHHLVKAFRATLEELAYADLLLHVADAADPARDVKMAVVYETLAQLGCGEKPVITLFNKMDLYPDAPPPDDPRASAIRYISAKRGDGKDAVIMAIEAALAAPSAE